MNGMGYMTDSQSSSQGTKRRTPSKKYFSVHEDFSILEKFKRKGMVDANDIVEDISLAINRDPSSIKERYKKLNSLTEDDKLRIINYVKVSLN
jgi:hypothetical protein